MKKKSIQGSRRVISIPLIVFGLVATLLFSCSQRQITQRHTVEIVARAPVEPPVAEMPPAEDTIYIEEAPPLPEAQVPDEKDVEPVEEPGVTGEFYPMEEDESLQGEVYVYDPYDDAVYEIEGDENIVYETVEPETVREVEYVYVQPEPTTQITYVYEDYPSWVGYRYIDYCDDASWSISVGIGPCSWYYSRPWSCYSSWYYVPSWSVCYRPYWSFSWSLAWWHHTDWWWDRYHCYDHHRRHPYYCGAYRDRDPYRRPHGRDRDYPDRPGYEKERWPGGKTPSYSEARLVSLRDLESYPESGKTESPRALSPGETGRNITEKPITETLSDRNRNTDSGKERAPARTRPATLFSGDDPKVPANREISSSRKPLALENRNSTSAGNENSRVLNRNVEAPDQKPERADQKPARVLYRQPGRNTVETFKVPAQTGRTPSQTSRTLAPERTTRDSGAENQSRNESSRTGPERSVETKPLARDSFSSGETLRPSHNPYVPPSTKPAPDAAQQGARIITIPRSEPPSSRNIGRSSEITVKPVIPLSGTQIHQPYTITRSQPRTERVIRISPPQVPVTRNSDSGKYPSSGTVMRSPSQNRPSSTGPSRPLNIAPAPSLKPSYSPQRISPPSAPRAPQPARNISPSAPTKSTSRIPMEGLSRNRP